MSRKVYVNAKIKIILTLEEGQEAEDVICDLLNNIDNSLLEDIELDSMEITDSK